MIIISQNNKIIANLDNLKTIQIQHLGGKYTISAYLQKGQYIILAEYEKEQKAIEILKELINANVVNYKTYLLPKE